MDRWTWGAKSRLRLGWRFPRAWGAWLSAALVTAIAHAQQAPAVPVSEGASSSPMDLTVCGNRVYFSADDGLHGRELWSVDASDVCTLEADIDPGAKGSDPIYLKDMGNGALFFAAHLEGIGREPYLRLQGTSETRLAGDIAPGSESSNPEPAFGHRGAIYFGAATENGQRCVYVTDQGGNSCAPLLMPGTTQSILVELLADGRFILATTNTMWVVAPDSTDAVQFYEAADGARLPIGHLKALGSVALFRGDSRASGSELWRTDGTAEGTRLLKDIRPGEGSSEMGPFVVVGGKAFFQANDGEHGNELWVTDGTAEGTVLAADLCPGAGGSDPHYFVAMAGDVYFCADDGKRGIELWRSDGSTPGTRCVSDLYPGSAGSQPWSLAEFRGKLHFCAHTPDYGEEVYCTDGTHEGTVVAFDLVPGNGSSGPDNLTNLKDERLFLTCNDGIHGEELWASDGSAAGTKLAADIWRIEARSIPSSKPHDLAVLGERLVFGAGDAEHGDELWASDGSEKGTTLIGDLNPGPRDSAPSVLAAMDGYVLLSAESQETGREVWRTDGTGEGTLLVKDVWTGVESGHPRMGAVAGGIAYFVADEESQTGTIWKTDGTSEGTSRVSNLTLELAKSRVEELFELRGHVYCYATSPNGDWVLWAVDVADGKPRRLGTAGMAMGLLEGKRGGNESSLSSEQRHDGLPASLISAIHPPGGGSGKGLCLTVGNETYFVANTTDVGAELWKTDGTWTGTTLVSDCFPGPASSSPVLLSAKAAGLLFVAEHPRHGRVLWETNGTARGTGVITLVGSTGEAGYPIFASEGCYVGEQKFAVCGAEAIEVTDRRDLLVVDRSTGSNLPQVIGGVEGQRLSGARDLTVLHEAILFVADGERAGEELWKRDTSTGLTTLVRDIFPRSSPVDGGE